jgi:hypothetical protein
MSLMYPQPDWRFVQSVAPGSSHAGSFLDPYTTIAEGVNGTPAGGTLWIQPDSYAAAGTYSKRMTWRVPFGKSTLR